MGIEFVFFSFGAFTTSINIGMFCLYSPHVFLSSNGTCATEQENRNSSQLPSPLLSACASAFLHGFFPFSKFSSFALSASEKQTIYEAPLTTTEKLVLIKSNDEAYFHSQSVPILQPNVAKR